MHYYYGPPTKDQIYGVSILSKWPIIEKEWKLMPNEQSIERAVIRVVIDTPMGEILVFNTHFQTSSYKLDQRKQAEFIINYVSDQKAIILGDFNTRSDLNDEAYTLLNNTFTYAWIEAGNHPNATASFSSPSMDPGHKVDYIWLTQGDWDVVEGSAYTAGNKWASDHLAVLASILI
jgi:endonuclease/exonuclease/phosphatase family metal-dependent hydrolase